MSRDRNVKDQDPGLTAQWYSTRNLSPVGGSREGGERRRFHLYLGTPPVPLRHPRGVTPTDSKGPFPPGKGSPSVRSGTRDLRSRLSPGRDTERGSSPRLNDDILEKGAARVTELESSRGSPDHGGRFGRRGGVGVGVVTESLLGTCRVGSVRGP